MRTLPYSSLIALLLLSPPGLAAEAEAVFAGGCFWCMEADFEKLDGVKEAISGFTGGTIKNPTYEGNHQGHYEVVKVIYDDSQVSYAQLLRHYWINIDPFDSEGQFCDKGHSYLPAIFVADPEQRQQAQASRQQVQAHFSTQKVAVPIKTLETFYPIRGKESYHQDYYQKYPVRYKFYRWNCGRDKRLQQIWGDPKTYPGTP